MKDGSFQPIFEFEGGANVVGYMAHGHIEKREFLDCVLKDTGGLWAENDVRHVYQRNVPVAHQPGSMVMVECAGPARGAYPVTLVDVY
jgi:hypothetical protein